MRTDHDGRFEIVSIERNRVTPPPAELIVAPRFLVIHLNRTDTDRQARVQVFLMRSLHLIQLFRLVHFLTIFNVPNT
jgi:hypothetical protein